MVTTKCGNQYSEIEWADMMRNWDQEVGNAMDCLEAEDTIKSIAAKRLVSEAGIDESKSYGVACHIYNNSTDGIQFTSTEKQLAVEEIDRWMTEQAKGLF